MFRKALIANRRAAVTDFRWRGGDVSRIEGFSDAVFGFALTLLVVSIEAPRKFGDLAAIMKGFPVFAICFTLLVTVWYEHYLFFRRFGLKDTWTLTLNMALLFVVMLYVYPLKFMFTLVIDMFSGGIRRGPDGKYPIEPAQIPDLMLIYACGFAAIYVIYALLYHNAWRRRERLELNPLEEFDTRASLKNHLGMVLIGVVSAAFALQGSGTLAGFTYFAIGPFQGVYWTISGGRRRRLETNIAREFAEEKAEELTRAN